MVDIDYNALGQVCDTTWGRSSTPQTASYSVKLSVLSAGRLMASYAVVVNFGTERQMIDCKRAQVTESESVVNEVMKHVKAGYKDLTGSALKVKEHSTVDSLEIINMNVHNAKRTAYYRRKTVFEIG